MELERKFPCVLEHCGNARHCVVACIVEMWKKNINGYIFKLIN
jgi:hypothetical protein